MTDAALATKTVRRLEYLDGLRALAALAVLIHHGWAMVFPPQLGVVPQGALALTTPAKFGPYGVAVFIILAGFSLTLAVTRTEGRLKTGAGTFLKRRAKRILPPYYAALLLTIALQVLWLNQKTGTHWDLSVPLNWVGVVTNVLLVQDLMPFEVTNVAYTFWSIAVEWHIYFTFPILLIVWRRYGYLVATGAGVVFGIAGGYLALEVPQLAGVRFEFYALFALGMGACAIAYLVPTWARRIPWLVVAALGVVMWAALAAFEAPAFLSPVLDPNLAVGIATCGLLIAVAKKSEGKIGRALSWRPIARLGIFSYSLYLVHAPLLQVFWLLVVEPLNLGQGVALAVIWAIAVPAIVGLAYLFHIVAERPFMNTRPAEAPSPRSLRRSRTA